MQRIKRFLLSPKTVISLIVAVGICCLMGSTIPQITENSPRFFEAWKAESPRVYFLIDLLQLNHVYTSIWFLILVALITSSLSYSIYYQSRILIKSRLTQRDITQSPFKDYLALKLVHSSELGVGGLGDNIKGIFKTRGYRPYLVTEGSKYFIFGKNRWGRWGTVIFHLGLFFCIMAALYGLAFQKRGFVQLVPTDTFQGKDEDWLVKSLGVFAKDFDLDFQVYLNNFIPTYWENDQIKDLETSLTIIDEKGEAKEFSISQGNPIHFNRTKIYQSTHYGYALGFVLKKEGSKEVLTHFLLDAPVERDKPFVGMTDFPTTDYILDMKFYPNLIEPSFYLAFPGVDLTVKEKGKVKFEGRVLFSQRAKLNNGDTLIFAQIHYWSGLIFVKNYGMPLVYGGFALSTMGAFLMFILPYKEMHLKVAEEGDHIQIALGGRTKRYQALFSEEFKEIAERLEKALGAQ